MGTDDMDTDDMDTDDIEPAGHEMPITNPPQFRADPGGHVYAVFDEPTRDIPAITAGLLAAKIPLDGMHVYCCSEGVDALDPSGKGHGLRARITRMAQSVAYDDDNLADIETELEAGHALLGVAVDEDRVTEVAAIIRRLGGHDLVHYGKHTWRRLSPKRR